MTLRTHISGCLLEPGVLGFLWETGITGDSGNTVFPDSLGTPGPRIPSERRVHVVTWNSVFTESAVTTGSLSQPELRVPGVTQNSGFHESPRISGSLGHPELLVTGVTRNSFSPE